MGFDTQRLALTNEPQQVLHPDQDFKPQHSAMCRCDGADIVVGGEGVTPATGYTIAAGTEWGFDGEDGAPFVMLAAGAGPVDMQVLWGGV